MVHNCSHLQVSACLCTSIPLILSNASTGNIIRHIIFLNLKTYTAKTGIKKWTLECSCVPKGVGATFCSKTGPFFSCGCSKPSGVPVWTKAAQATFCSKTGPFFSCGCSKLSCASCAYASILETLKDLSLAQKVWVASRGGKN